jgi:hypothetical protein
MKNDAPFGGDAMTVDRSFIERNRAATERIRQMSRLSDAELQARVGEHWTVAILLAHLAFWDQRVLFAMQRTEQQGKLFPHEADGFVNDYALPLLAAIPPRETLRLAIEAAEAVDHRLEAFPTDLLEQIHTHNPRWVDRSLHRNEHLDEADAALK